MEHVFRSVLVLSTLLAMSAFSHAQTAPPNPATRLPASPAPIVPVQRLAAPAGTPAAPRKVVQMPAMTLKGTTWTTKTVSMPPLQLKGQSAQTRQATLPTLTVVGAAPFKKTVQLSPMTLTGAGKP